MDATDIKIVLDLAKAALDDRRASHVDEDVTVAEEAIEAVELWMRAIGVLPPQ
jgi:hypothetical protein